MTLPEALRAIPDRLLFPQRGNAERTRPRELEAFRTGCGHRPSLLQIEQERQARRQGTNNP
jgi:hypothetical protein